MLKTSRFPSDATSKRVRPRITPENRAFHDGLVAGRLRLPHCAACSRAIDLSMASCPFCSGDVIWIESAGSGVLHSWVRYHRAFMDEFQGVLPYCVVSVQMDEGVRLFGRWIDADVEPRIGQRAQAVSEAWGDGFCGLAFEMGEGGEE
jgi:uncharacterized OB-fold protein